MASKAGRKRARSLLDGNGSVRFSTSVSVMLMENNSNDQQQRHNQKSNLWYSDADFYQFQYDSKRVAAAALASVMMGGESSLSNLSEWHQELRGVEHHLCAERRKRQALARRAVMETQKKLRRGMAKRRLGLDIPHLSERQHVEALLAIVPPTEKEREDQERLLARVSTKFTKWASNVAIAAAARDAEEVQEQDRGSTENAKVDMCERAFKRRRTSLTRAMPPPSSPSATNRGDVQ